MRALRLLLLCSLCCYGCDPVVASLADSSLLGTGAERETILVRGALAAPIFVSESDWPGVHRAAQDLQADIERVTGVRPAYSPTTPATGSTIVVVGTLGKSPVIDGLAES